MSLLCEQHASAVSKRTKTFQVTAASPTPLASLFQTEVLLIGEHETSSAAARVADNATRRILHLNNSVFDYAVRTVPEAATLTKTTTATLQSLAPKKLELWNKAFDPRNEKARIIILAGTSCGENCQRRMIQTWAPLRRGKPKRLTDAFKRTFPEIIHGFATSSSPTYESYHPTRNFVLP